MVFIGIDPGVTTGYAEFRDGKLQNVKSFPIFLAQGNVLEAFRYYQGNVFVVVEDARKRKKFSKEDWNPKKLQNVGSVKRDCSIWEEYLTYFEIPFVMKHPRNTKIVAKVFQRMTGYKGRTNQHARDAAMLVYGMKMKKNDSGNKIPSYRQVY